MCNYSIIYSTIHFIFHMNAKVSRLYQLEFEYKSFYLSLWVFADGKLFKLIRYLRLNLNRTMAEGCFKYA
jgi:hypothetical protein